MKLDRNANADGKGKYAIINLRLIIGNPQTPQELAAAILVNPESVEFGRVGSPDEFWVIKLKDRYAGPALERYAESVLRDKYGDREYADEILELANRSGQAHPLCKRPD